MLPTTLQAVTAVLRADPSLTSDDRIAITAAIRCHGKTTTAENSTTARVLRRAEVARRLGCTSRTVDNLAAQGILPRLSFPGRVRGCGFREADVQRLVEGVQ